MPLMHSISTESDKWNIEEERERLTRPGPDLP